MRVFTKRKAGLMGLGLVAGLAFTAVAYAATFGPSRPTFTWLNTANYVTFNSITDNPTWGDERFIVKARDASLGSSANSTSVQVKDGQELLVTTYFHNNAAANLNLVAKNTKVRVDVPTSDATSKSLKSHISASNSNPLEVYSTVDLTGSEKFVLDYIEGSAQLKTNKITTALSDDVVKDGVLVGTNGPDGNVPGCGEFSGYVTIRVKVKKVVTPPPVSKFECKALDLSKVDRTRYTFTARAAVENATVSKYVFTTKNSSGSVVDTTTVTTNALSAVYNFNQSTAGTYTVSVIVHTDKGNTSVKDECTKQVTVDAEPVVKPEVTPTPTKQLPDTGAGSLVGVFAGASALGTAGHYLFRRFRA